MSFELTSNIIAVVVGFPLLLLLLILVLSRIEDWMLMPDERAAAVSELLEQVEKPEELEKAVALMMSEVADQPTTKEPSPAARIRSVRLAGRRRA